MENEPLNSQERSILLGIARHAIEKSVNQLPIDELDIYKFPQRLQEQGASFVTLTLDDQLRGCIGSLEAYQPLALDVQEHAVAAALEDYRFPPVMPGEVEMLEIEISCLTPSQPLDYSSSQELISKLRPGIDGVVLRSGMRRSTFLPQVWEKLPTPQEFLTQLCYKMGASGDLWQREKLQVLTYQVEEFRESIENK